MSQISNTELGEVEKEHQVQTSNQSCLKPWNRRQGIKRERNVEKKNREGYKATEREADIYLKLGLLSQIPQQRNFVTYPTNSTFKCGLSATESNIHGVVGSLWDILTQIPDTETGNNKTWLCATSVKSVLPCRLRVIDGDLSLLWMSRKVRKCSAWAWSLNCWTSVLIWIQ